MNLPFMYEEERQTKREQEVQRYIIVYLRNIKNTTCYE